MKYKLFILTSFILGNIYSQCTTIGTYDFKSGNIIKPSSFYGLYPSSEEFAEGKLDPLERITPQTDGLQIKSSGKNIKKPFSELGAENWGYQWFNITYRIYESDFKEAWVSESVSIIGNICLYGLSADKPVKNESGGYSYTYCYMQLSESSISNGLSGKVYRLTNKNFSLILSEIDSNLSNDYLNDLNKIEGAKLESVVSFNKEIFKLFTKYFELANNKK